MTTPVLSPAPQPTAPKLGMKAFVLLYKLVLRHQVTRGRLVLIGLMSAVTLLLGFLLFRDSGFDRVNFIEVFSLGLTVPVLALVFGSAALGDWVNDETLVYVWLKPVSRLWIAAASTLAALTVAIPANVIPPVAALLLAGDQDTNLTLGTLWSILWATIAYTAVFVFFGLLLKRALVFGLIYIFIWEFFIARAGAGAARLSISSYAKSILARWSDTPLDLADRAVWSSWVIPPLIAVVAVALTTWRLHRASVT